MNVSPIHLRAYRPVATQRGVVLFVALIALVAMTLAGIALVRSIDTTVVAAGNMSFREAAVSGGNVGIETAIAFLNTQTTLQLNSDNPAQNYYSTFSSGSNNAALPAPQPNNAYQSVPGTFAVDTAGRPTSWPGTGPAIFPGEAAFAGTAPAIALPDGSTVSYAIQRLCHQNVNPAIDDRTDQCVTDPITSQPSAAKGLPPNIYFRITAITRGSRNTVSYVQAMVGKP